MNDFEEIVKQGIEQKLHIAKELKSKSLHEVMVGQMAIMNATLIEISALLRILIEQNKDIPKEFSEGCRL